ncbi:MAG: hypothetical protein A2X05_02740 [Bacteroidetes bacterium GWE2_41_25]|nr:MAG: hypothetical protein A2X05_02740 [Bacteroidetes bacterium GWE2_41_25]
MESLFHLLLSSHQTAFRGLGVASWISGFLRTYHGFRPEREGAPTVRLFWGMMILFLPLAYILSLSFWADPIIKNSTIKRIGKTTNQL